jgi:hypothetical protein
VENEAGRRVVRPAGCRAYIRKELAKQFPEIVDGFVKEAKSGSVPHLRLATELLQPERKDAQRRKGETARMLDRMVKNRPVKEEEPDESE